MLLLLLRRKRRQRLWDGHLLLLRLLRQPISG
jgi:hypothetical protein